MIATDIGSAGQLLARLHAQRNEAAAHRLYTLACAFEGRELTLPEFGKDAVRAYWRDGREEWRWKDRISLTIPSPL